MSSRPPSEQAQPAAGEEVSLLAARTKRRRPPERGTERSKSVNMNPREEKKKKQSVSFVVCQTDREGRERKEIAESSMA